MVEINNMKGCILSFVVVGLIVFLVSFSSAFAVGVSGDLGLYPGQTFDIVYDVMNTIGGSGNIVVEGQFLEGGEIVSFTKGTRFSISAGTVTPVPVRYKIPANAVVGTVYPIKVIFRTVSEGQGSGSVSFAEDVVRSLNIRITEIPAEIEIPIVEESTRTQSVLIWVLAILIVILIIWFVLKSKKKSSMDKGKIAGMEMSKKKRKKRK